MGSIGPQDDSRWAALLMAHGGPGAPDEVEPYLRDIRGGRPTSPELLADVQRRYAMIGGRSPLLDITRAQARALEVRLEADLGDRAPQVYVGMLHWRPYIRDAVAEMAADGVRRVVALCLAPHYSRMSVGSYFARLEESRSEVGARLDVVRVESWHDNPLLVGAIAEKVEAALDRFPAETRGRVAVVFTAHSLPAAAVAEGDPYDAQVRETASLVAERAGLGADRWGVAYQSAGARPGDWLEPSLSEALGAAAAFGRPGVLVAPVGFVADNVEILYDLDVEAQALARRLEVRLERAESLNAAPRFVEALADVVRRTLSGA